MQRTVAIGISNFEKLIKYDVFYVDKTSFIKEWWERVDEVTLITRPRRFGKTLTLNMVETFFSNQYENRADLFEKFSIWEDEKFQKMQGTYPVINLSLADVKQDSYESMTAKMKRIIATLYRRHKYLLESKILDDGEKNEFEQIMYKNSTDEEYMEAILKLSEYMYHHFGEKVMILIDEYDTPMLEAYVAGYWEDAIVYIRRMFHAAFKDNPYLERALLTGITRITQESIFSDLNNIAVATTTIELYEECFGFTEKEVFSALEQYDLEDKKEEVKRWYDGFQFGKVKDIYNPWSIINYLKFKKFSPYWMNTSSNSLVGKLVQEGSLNIKEQFEILLQGGSTITEIDESITYAELTGDANVVWSWLVTTGYLKIVEEQGELYEVALTNYEVQVAFYKLIKKWFGKTYDNYGNFMKMLLNGNLEQMQRHMEKVILYTFSYFDVGSGSSENEKAEHFYHGFTLGLIADLQGTHIVTSNRESGFGRYDVCIEPIDKKEDGIIIEFKLFDEKEDESLEDTAKRALEQVEKKQYETELKNRGIENIRKYGFAFKGKEVVIVG